MKQFFKLTKFFIKRYLSYMKPLDFYDYLYFPIAYVKFLWYTYKKQD